MPSKTDLSAAKRRIMADIETLGLDRDKVILSIGIVEFGPARMGNTFETSIPRKFCEAAGLTVDKDTLDRWQEQPGEAQAVLTGGNKPVDVLECFANWGAGLDEVCANSPSLDCEALEYTGEQVDVEMPWKFYQKHDYRTIKSLPMTPEKDNDGIEHEALDSAYRQALVAATALKRLEAVEKVMTLEAWN
jgi:hypothetical protein